MDVKEEEICEAAKALDEEYRPKKKKDRQQKKQNHLLLFKKTGIKFNKEDECGCCPIGWFK